MLRARRQGALLIRLVILTSSRFGTASVCLPVLAQSPSCSVVSVIVSHAYPASRFHRTRQKLKKTFQIGCLGALNGIRMRSWYDGDTTEDLVELCRRLGIPVFETSYTNGDDTARLFREANADLGLSLGNGYIASRIFSIPKFGMINVHGERLPEYQNAQSVIWPIFNGETTTGLTVHQIDRTIDTGSILYREEFPIVFHPEIQNTVTETVKETRRRTPGAVRHVCENFAQLMKDAVPQDKGRKFSTPSIWQFLRMSRNNKCLCKAKSRQ